MSSRVRNARGRRRASGGFSLIELLVVVMIIGILAALALPTMSSARFDQQTYSDAGAIMQLFRTARTRAAARGGAQLVAMTAKAGSDRGTFQLWESVSPDPTGNGANRLPVSSCALPTKWLPLDLTGGTNLGISFVDGVNLNTATGATPNTIEVDADIQTTMQIYADPTSNTAAGFNTGFVCYTPLGRSYVNTTAGTPSFDGVLPTVGVLELYVTRAGGGTIRSVLLPPNGMARLFSHT